MPPLERHPLLRPLSREHHEGLLFCWKLRQGLAKSVGPAQLQQEARETYHAHLLPHFAIEEEAVFPVLGHGHPLVMQALAEHAKLTAEFLRTDHDERSLFDLQRQLDDHIRFEERVLFPKVQENASEEQLAYIEQVHGGIADRSSP